MKNHDSEQGRHLWKPSPDLKHVEAANIDSNSFRYLHILGLQLGKIIIEPAFLILVVVRLLTQSRNRK